MRLICSILFLLVSVGSTYASTEVSLGNSRVVMDLPESFKEIPSPVKGKKTIASKCFQNSGSIRVLFMEFTGGASEKNIQELKNIKRKDTHPGNTIWYKDEIFTMNGRRFDHLEFGRMEEDEMLSSLFITSSNQGCIVTIYFYGEKSEYKKIEDQLENAFLSLEFRGIHLKKKLWLMYFCLFIGILIIPAIILMLIKRIPKIIRIVAAYIVFVVVCLGIFRVYARLTDYSFEWIEQRHVQLLYVAASEGNIEEAGNLISEGADINKLDSLNGAAPIHAAAAGNKADMVSFLIESGANVDVQDKDGITSLIFAANFGYVDIVKILLENRANTNITTFKNKGTALMNAVIEGHNEIVSFLLENGADYSLKDINGKAALAFAREKKHSKIEELLIQAGAKE